MLRTITFLALFACSAPALSQPETPSTVPWAYSAYFGTGWYRLSASGDVFVAQGTPEWTLSKQGPGGEKPGVDVVFKLPMSVGFENFAVDDPTGVLDPDNVAIASVTPAIAVTIPVNDTWTLRPFGAVGWGTVLGESDSAWAYWAGIKSRLAFERERATISVVNLFGYVGNTPDNAASDYFLPAMAGVEVDWDMPDWRIGDDPVFLSWHLSYTRFFDDFEIVFRTGEREPIPDQWGIGFSFGKIDKPLEVWWLRFDRFGVEYRTSSDGELKGVGLVFRSLFDR